VLQLEATQREAQRLRENLQARELEVQAAAAHPSSAEAQLRVRRRPPCLFPSTDSRRSTSKMNEMD